MVENLGVDSCHGWGLESTWDTSVAATAMPNVLSNGLATTTVNNPSNALAKRSSMGRHRRGADVLAGAVVIGWTYDTDEVWLEQFMGLRTAAVSPLEDHYDFQTRMTESFTYAENKRNSVVHEYSGCRITQATLAGNPTDGFQWTLNVLGGTEAVTGTTNTAGGLAGLTIPGNEINWEDATLRIADLGDAIAAGDAINPASIGLDINRNAIHNFTTSRTPLEPQVNGFANWVLTFDIERVDTDQFLTWRKAGTLVQADITWDNGTDNPKVLRLPVGRVTSSPEPTAGPELQTQSVEVMFEHNVDAANAFTDFTFEEAGRFFEDDGA